MGKDQDFQQAVKDQDLVTVQKILIKSRMKHTKIVSSNKKFNINQQDNDGMAALHQAALAGNMDVMRTILDSGASVDIKDNKGMRPLHYATWQGRAEPVQLLLEYGASTTDASYDRETPLHLACQHGHYEVVNLLLCYHADPTVRDKEHKTPLDLACEFGRFQVVELLLRSNLCCRLLTSSQDDMLDNQRTTCLHLAARNGHTDVVRLLLHAGVDINRQTLQGTCLHEAALHGKIDVVVLLLDYGVDVNQANSYDQTALDIVNRFTTSRAAKDLKQVLKEASLAVAAIAEQDYYNPKDPSHLQFRKGDCLQVLEQNADGAWRGYLSHEGYSKSGYFSSAAVRLLDDHGPSNYPSVKYQQPPRWRPEMMHTRAQIHPGPHGSSQPHLVGSQPDLPGHAHGGHSAAAHGHQPMHGSQPQLGGPQYASVGHDASFPPPPMPLMSGAQAMNPAMSDSYESVSSHQHHHNGPYHTSNPQLHAYPAGVARGKYSPHPASVSGGGGGDGGSSGTVTGPCPPEYVGGGGGMPYRCYDVNGEVRSASPCRDSPTNSNRNSAASTDSGRGGSATTFPSYMALNQHRLSGHSCESGVSSRISYHSNSSSSSLGSLDRLEESGYSSQVNVAELVQSGLSDHDIIHAWLSDLHFEEYYNNFMAAGYDMGVISRMTPEDLNAIGITKPGHRKRLKSEIAKLHIHDGIPDYKPADFMDWLRLLNLDQYYDTLMNQGYDNLDQVMEITWEDLEEIGIKKLGHQKKMILAIDRLKRIQSGAKRHSITADKRGSGDLLDNPRAMQALPYPAHMRRAAELTPPQSPLSKEITIATIKPRRSPSADSGSSTPAPEMRTFQYPRDDGSLERMRKSGQADLVAIHVARQRLESSESARSNSPHMFHSFHGGQGVVDDAAQTATRERDESTPTNEHDDRSSESPSRRPSAMVSPRVSHKPKPVAKIMAKTRRDSQEEIISSKDEKDDICKPSEHIYENTDNIKSDESDTSSLPRCKKPPPPPPKRTNSMKDDDEEEVPVIPPCVKSLSDRFDKINTEGRRCSLPNDEAPPAPRKPMITPPAIARIAMEGGLKNCAPPVSPKPLVSRLAQHCASKQDSSDEDEMGTIRRNKVKRNASGGSIDSTLSTGSVDSNTLPFANENVGTIKQRSSNQAPKQPPAMVPVDIHEPCQESATIKRRTPAPLLSSCGTGKGLVGAPTGVGGGFKALGRTSGASSPVPPLGACSLVSSGSTTSRGAGGHVTNLTNLTADYPDTIEDALKCGGRSTDTGDVLNDIDNMLQDLTDELDFMLVTECEEKAA